MQRTSKLFSTLVMFSLVMALGAAPAFTNGAVVRAQDIPPTPALVATPPPPQPSHAPALAPLLQDDSASVIPGAYIVVYKAGMDSPHVVRDGAARMTALGAKVGHIYAKVVHGFSAELSPEALDTLRRDPQVDYVASDEMGVTVDGNGVKSSQGSPDWGLDRIDQRALPLDNSYHYLYDGSGVNVYVIDSGILTSLSDFGGRAIMDVDEVDGSMVDCNGHGTHVAGIIGGTTYGVAKGVTLHGIRVSDCDGHWPVSRFLAGVEWIILNVARPAVANISLGISKNGFVDLAVNALVLDGVPAVVAAGNGTNNDGIAVSACTQSPSDVSRAIVVGATGNYAQFLGGGSPVSDARASFSNFGSCVDVFAPGVGITSDWFGGTNADEADCNGLSTCTLSGTSQAAPHVTGAAALYLQAHPGSSPSNVAAGLIDDSTTNVVTNAGTGSPNRLLFAFGTPMRPTLIAPANNFLTNNPAPLLSWDGATDGATYEVQIASTSNFATPAQDHAGGVGEWDYTVNPALSDGKYYWHVRGINLGGEAGPWSTTRVITLDTLLPAAPLLSLPLSGAVVRGTPPFKWMAVATANAYQFAYDDSSDCNSPLYTSPVLSTTTYTPPAMAVGIFYWCVHARDAAGNWGSWSTPWTVNIYPLIPAKPVLTSPPTGSQTNDLTPTLTWGAVPYGATYEVQIDDLSTFASPNYDSPGIGAATFDAGPLATGTWYWRVRAVNVHSEAGPWSTSRYFSVYASFDSEFNSDRAGWTDQPGAAWTLNTANGYLSTPGLDSTSFSCGTGGAYTCYDEYTSSASHDGNFTDLTYEARMKMDFDGAPDYYINAYGLVVRGNGPINDAFNDWHTAYYFQVGQYYYPPYSEYVPIWSVWKVVNGVWTRLTSYYWYWSPAVNFGDWNVLKAVVHGTSLKYYINGTLVFSRSDSAFSTGQLAVETWRVGTGTTYVDYAKAGGPQGTAIPSVLSTEQVETPVMGFMVDPSVSPIGARITSATVLNSSGDRR